MMSTKRGPDPYRWSLEEHWRREVGVRTPLHFSRRVGGCQDLIRRFRLYAELDGHSGCVNTVHFNASGDVLVSGSDDRDIVVWDWAAKVKKLSFPSGHEDNVFQARIMPFSDNQTIITSGADGQVREADISESGSVLTKKLAQHRGRVHKLAVEPGSSRIFMSCGEDGVVRRFDLRDGNNKAMFQCHGRTGFAKIRRIVRLHSIVANTTNLNYFAVGGSDKFVRVYDIRKVRWGGEESPDDDPPLETLCPTHLRDNKGALHVTGLAYSHREELLASYSDEQIYLFGKDPEPRAMASPSENGPCSSGTTHEPQVYKGHRNAHTIKGVSFLGPNSEYVVSGSDCGNIFIWKKKGAELISLFKGDNQVVNCLEPHPHATFLATSGIENIAKIWAPVAEEYVSLPSNADKIMKANQRGREEGFQRLSDIMHVLRLQRRREVAGWISMRERPRHGRGGEGEESSDNEERVVDNYLMVLYRGGDGGSDEEEEEEEEEESQGFSRECSIS